jgi:hypothetical protein
MPTRKKISLREKINLASMVRRIRSSSDQNKPSLKALARSRGVSPFQLRKWERQLDSLIQQPNLTKCSLNEGRKSFLAPIKDRLLFWLSNIRQDGIPVSVRMLTVKAMEMLPTFSGKSTDAKYMAVYRLLKSHGYTIRSKTRVSQASAASVRELCTQFMRYVRPLLVTEDRDKNWILNMDQTAVFFSMMPRTTVDQRGARTVTVRNTNNGDQRVTVAVSLTAAGRLLKPFIVLKGKDGNL